MKIVGALTVTSIEPRELRQSVDTQLAAHGAVSSAGPHALHYLRLIRLERARQSLEYGATVTHAATQAGFYRRTAATGGARRPARHRATEAATIDKWLAAGVVAAVRSAAFRLSNRADPTGACGGVGWIIDPYGTLLARTSADAPFVTLDIDLRAPDAASTRYPGYIFSGTRWSDSR